MRILKTSFFNAFCVFTACASLAAQNNNQLRSPTPFNYSIRIPDYLYYDFSPEKVDENGDVRVRFYLELLNQVLVFNKGDRFYDGNLTLQLDIKEGSRYVRRILWQDSLTASSFRETLSQYRYSRIEKKFSLPPANYSVEINIKDNVSGKMKTIQTEVELTDFSNGPNVIAGVRFYRGDTYEVNQAALHFNTPYNIGYFHRTERALRGKVYIKEGQKLRYTRVFNVPESKVFSFDTLRVPMNKLREGRYRFEIVFDNQQQIIRDIEIVWWDKPRFLYQPEFALRPFMYLLNSTDSAYFSGLNLSAKLDYWNTFWQSQHPTRTNGYNPLKTEFYQRVDEAVRKYSSDKVPGFETPTGKAYILFGPPLKEKTIFRNNRRYLIWIYRDFEKHFVFDPNELLYIDVN